MTDHQPERSYESRRWDLGGDTRIIAAVNPDGTEDYWLLDPDANEGCGTVPAHELTGPLPGDVRARIAATLARQAEPRQRESR